MYRIPAAVLPGVLTPHCRYAYSLLGVCLPLARGADDLCLAVEGADVGGQGVEVMEAAVVAVCRHMGDVAHRVEIPGRQDEQAAVDTCLEAPLLGFPVRTDGLLLQVYQRVAIVKASVFHELFASRDARRYHDGGTLHDGRFPLPAIAGIVVSVFVGLAGDGMAAVAHHLHLAGPSEQEQVAEGSVAALAYLHM